MTMRNYLIQMAKGITPKKELFEKLLAKLKELKTYEQNEPIKQAQTIELIEQINNLLNTY